MEDYERRMNELLGQIVEDTQKFLEENPTLKFYSVGFDCNSEYAEILLCFNTEESFQKTLNHYQEKYGKSYDTDELICELRFNTGDWEYQGIAVYTVFSEEELTEMYHDDYEKISSDMMNFNYELLRRFCQTQCYNSIPKTDNFKPICADHDEDAWSALQQTERMLQGKTAQESWLSRY